MKPIIIQNSEKAKRSADTKKDSTTEFALDLLPEARTQVPLLHAHTPALPDAQQHMHPRARLDNVTELPDLQCETRSFEGRLHFLGPEEP